MHSACTMCRSPAIGQKPLVAHELASFFERAYCMVQDSMGTYLQRDLMKQPERNILKQLRRLDNPEKTEKTEVCQGTATMYLPSFEGFKSRVSDYRVHMDVLALKEAILRRPRRQRIQEMLQVPAHTSAGLHDISMEASRQSNRYSEGPFPCRLLAVPVRWIVWGNLGPYAGLTTLYSASVYADRDSA